MSEELDNEIEAINSIYGENTIREAPHSAPHSYLLAIPQHEVTLRLSIPIQYPDINLDITAVEGVGSTSQRGFGNHTLLAARNLIQKAFTPGQVCLFDLLQELEQLRDPEPSTNEDGRTEDSQRVENSDVPRAGRKETTGAPSEALVPPQWALSSTVTEKKSLFIGRVCGVNSSNEVQSAIAHLLATDKRASKAAHNISAYRIRTSFNEKEVIYQDCEDDGEAAAGGRLLRLLQMMDVWNVLVVVSRWYGGVKLGPARFGIINAVAREAVVAGVFAKD
ncbi:MAG: hypothetical protein LQ343_001566 [Gyalolechia ehrenbergii]|nr:MAG: hypothetical protein LQ343_001566 [Gyalolechia ehrenbergii]